MVFLLVVVTATIAICLIPVFKICSHYLEARKIGLPILITPIAILNPIWALAGNFIGPILLALPFGLGNFVKYSGFSWFYDEGYAIHEKYGPAFSIVTPAGIEVIIADPQAIEEITSRRKDFIKAPEMYMPLDIFGRNVDSINGEDWQRHRRITTPPFNERNSARVWAESIKQADGMLKSWLSIGNDGVGRTKKDAMTVALHVLTSAGLGKSYAFEGGLTKLTDGHTMSYKDALHVVIGDLFRTIIIKSINLPEFLLPRKLKELKGAISEFQSYMTKMVEDEKSRIHEKTAEQDNLLSVLVRLSEQEGEGRNGLSNEEIYGNLFIYNLAGHDTTANTIAYAVMLMASDITWQRWIMEELQTVCGNAAGPEDWDYEKIFPKLKRCMALLNETTRLYGPVPGVARYTNTSSRTLQIKGKKYTIPPNTYLPINLAAMHSLPEYWGSDSHIWRPDRWIIKNGAQEELYQPPPGLYLPWLMGPRVCPGKKFAQVEFVAVILRLFRRHRVKPVLNPGETIEAARKRILDVVNDSHILITLQMKHPEKVKLVWEDVDR